MSATSLISLAGGYVQSILSNAFQGAGSSTNQTNNLSATQQADNSQLSPFAQLLGTLQQLQQADPTKYQQVTQQIATSLQSAGQAAQSQGNSTAANQLNQLAADFTNASTSGQLPNVQDLAQAAGGHHHHHHSHSGGSSDPSQLSSIFQTNASQSDAQNPLSIILNALSNAGVSAPGS
jgi:aromatic ring hydroxylase